jgi:hypothetical protein
MIYDWTVTIDGVDVSDLIPEAGTIDYGRQGTGTAFAAPRAEFVMFSEAGHPEYAGTWPVLEDGQPVIVHVTWDGITQWRRFTGKIQALDYSATRIRVTCAGNTVDYQDFPAGGTGAFYPRTIEPDTTRVAWLADGAPEALDVEGAQGGRVRQIEKNTPSGKLLEQILRVADDCGGHFLEDRLGVPRYRTRNFTIPGAYTLPSSIVQWDQLSMSKDRGDKLSTVRVYYGEPDPATGLQKVRSDTDSAMAIDLGFDKSNDYVTDLRTPEAADARVAQLLAEGGDVYRMPDVVLLMSEATGEQADDILDFQEGWAVTVEPLPDGWPLASYDGRIIGFTEVMSADYPLVLHLEPLLTIDGFSDDDPIYPDGIITGYDATDTQTVDGKEYRWCRWDTSGSFTVDYTTAVYTRVPSAAGGGGGGSTPGGTDGSGGGGGAGGYMDEYLDLNPGSWPITIGQGGAVNTNGTDTVIYGTRLYGGGRGGYGSDSNGADGGSGGGASFNRASGALFGDPGVGVVGQGYDGAYGGGGATAEAASGSPFPGGVGATLSTPWGTVTLAAGGEGEGSGATPTANTGSGGQGGYIGAGATPGADGVVYMRYRIG